ncbi:hypothetical protein F5Y17DRAFT_411963 [Xylariaceae sp. FL0594]|nr:hypothetical protein F5Y17DRAFT_411963 [Xylariaceae sp. FL0594]
MGVLRVGSSFNALRGIPTRALQRQNRTFLTTSRLGASGYGDGKGDPKAEHPEKQPAHSKTQESSEHPGPAAPDVGKGSKKSPEEASAQSGGSRSKEAVETGKSPTGGAIPNNDGSANGKGGEALKGPQGKGAPQPKIHNQSVPGVKPGLTEEQKQEVERHNRDFEKKHDKAESAPSDKVNKSFWSGTGGRQGGEQDWNA